MELFHGVRQKTKGKEKDKQKRQNTKEKDKINGYLKVLGGDLSQRKTKDKKREMVEKKTKDNNKIWSPEGVRWSCFTG